MKIVISVKFIFLFSTLSICSTAQNFSHFPKMFSGKKITSSLEQNSKASGNSNQQPVNSGGMTITVNNSGQSFNTLVRSLSFDGSKDGVKAQCRFIRIKTLNKNGSGESFADSDNPFERPASMEKLGERYDNLVKEKSIYTITPSGVKKEAGSELFSDYWNQFLPYLTLDTMLNFVVFNTPGTVWAAKEKAWTDSAQNSFIAIKNNYKVTADDGTMVTIECKGTNIFTVDPAFEKTSGITLKIQRLESKYSGILLIDKATGFIKEATFEAITSNRKNVMGQKIDSERKEIFKVANKQE